MLSSHCLTLNSFRYPFSRESQCPRARVKDRHRLETAVLSAKDEYDHRMVREIAQFLATGWPLAHAQLVQEPNTAFPTSDSRRRSGSGKKAEMKRKY